jgi:hypothetical protein
MISAPDSGYLLRGAMTETFEPVFVMRPLGMPQVDGDYKERRFAAKGREMFSQPILLSGHRVCP